MRWLLLCLLFLAGPAWGATVGIAPPDCSTESDLDISSDAHWSSINASSAGDPFVACVSSGDYTGASDITLTADGTEANPRWIIFDGADAGSHAYHRSSGNKAKVRRIICQGDWWRVVGISFTRPGELRIFDIDPSCDHLILDSIEMSDGGNGGGMIQWEGSHGVLQNSVLYDTFIDSSGGDNLCVKFKGAAITITNSQILNNEFINCGDGIHIGDSTDDVGYETILIEDNDIYITSAIYTDCAGNLTPSGNCACAENAIDMKQGTTTTNVITVRGNRMWGFRPADSQCGGSDVGAAVQYNFSTVYVLMEDNIIWDNNVSFTTSNEPKAGEPDMMRFTSVNNLMIDHGARGIQFNSNTEDVEIYYNTVLDSGEGTNEWLVRHVGSNSEAYCNVFGDSNGDSFTTTMGGGNDSDYNVYADADVMDSPESNSVEVASIAALNLGSFSVITKKITNPTVVTFSNVLLDPSSPSFELCAGLTIGDTPGRGVDETTTYSRPHAGFNPPWRQPGGRVGR